MKKIIIGVLLIFSGLLGYSQIPDITPPVLFQNQQSYGAIRGIINTNASNFASYANRLRDSISSHNLRLIAIEKDTAAYKLEGSGSTYTFSNGLTNNSGNVSLGGTLTSNTAITTGTSNSLSIYTAPTNPSSGYRSLFNLGNLGITQSSSNYIASALSTGGTLSIGPLSGFNLYGTLYGKYSSFAHNTLGPLIQSDVPSSPNYRTVNLTNEGFVYGGDYSGSFADNSLITKKYLDDLLTSSILYDGLSFVNSNANITYSRGLAIQEVGFDPGYSYESRSIVIKDTASTSHAFNGIYFGVGVEENHWSITSNSGSGLSINDNGTDAWVTLCVEKPQVGTQRGGLIFDGDSVTITPVIGSPYKLGSGSDFNGGIVSNELQLQDTLYLDYLNLSPGDTVALLAIGETEHVDSASLVPAAGGWDKKLPSYRKFYRESKKLKSLPLNYPNLGTAEAHGQARRKLNPKYQGYQIEGELETVHRYMHRQRIVDKIQWGVIG